MSKLPSRFLVFAASVLPCLAVDTVTVFVKGNSPALDAARSEVSRLMKPAGFSIDWKNISERRAGMDFERLVIVELKGNCSANPAAGSATVDVRSLASTAIVDGKVLPFSLVDCDSLRKLMSSTQAGLKLFGRAMGRVIAHELYHMLAQTKTHSTAGVSKSCFSVADLMADRFDFDGVTLAQLRRPEEVAAPVAYDFSSDDSGR
jgi:hypothetical protein